MKISTVSGYLLAIYRDGFRGIKAIAIS